jgi:hypothetical protein
MTPTTRADTESRMAVEDSGTITEDPPSRKKKYHF